jgi:hypothetical protein
MVKLEALKWSPKWVSHLGCIKGCTDYLDLDISDAWLYGATGHAFVINVHSELCPSGPTAWKTEKLFELGPNAGYKIDGVFGFKGNPNFSEIQKQGWENVKQALDQGYPCYGWELEIPEFYVVYGYDNGAGDAPAGYYYRGPGCEEGKGPKPWQELGDTGIGVLELYSIRPGQPADDATTVKQALAFALDHAASPKEWIFDGYRAGLEGYDNWIAALSEGKASDMGTRYNTGVWLECRKYAVGFLEEAQTRLAVRADAVLGEALNAYQIVVESLAQVAELYPWLWEASDEDRLPVDDKSCAAVEALQAAKAAEAAGLQALAKIVQAL